MCRWTCVLVGLAALSGASGVTELAAAAHTIKDPLLSTSGNLLIVNAAAVIAIGAAANRKSWLLVGATTLFAGSLLFCGELSVHAFLQQRPFPLLAPIGGTLMILGWLITAAAALAGNFQRRD